LTDHKPLTFAHTRTANAWSARQQRQLSAIAEYTTDIRHVAGSENVVADALSRPSAMVAAVEPADNGDGVDCAQLPSNQLQCEEV
jgi:predicted ArsR family transcriptional regulator